MLAQAGGQLYVTFDLPRVLINGAVRASPHRGRCCEQTLTETGSLLSLKAWKLKLRGCCVAFLMGTRFPEHSRCSGMPSISCRQNHSRT